MFLIARLYNSACSYAAKPIRIQPIFMSIVFHHYRQLLKLKEELVRKKENRNLPKSYRRSNMSLFLAACRTPSTRQTHKRKESNYSCSQQHSYNADVEFCYFEHRIILVYWVLLVSSALLLRT